MHVYSALIEQSVITSLCQKNCPLGLSHSSVLVNDLVYRMSTKVGTLLQFWDLLGSKDEPQWA